MQQIAELPNKKYQIILADPPWQYQDKNCNGNCASHYNTMSVKEICAIPVKELADANCVLLLWATYPMLPEALQVIKAWGFKYKTIAFQWVKKNRSGQGLFYGLGRWTRGNTEPCLLAVKGKPTRINNSVFQIIAAPVGKHSQKPKVQYSLIEKLLGDIPRVELFARDAWAGWDVWGNQTPDSEQSLLMAAVNGGAFQSSILLSVDAKNTSEAKA